MFEVDESNINFVKESPELNFDSITQKENDLKYLNYVDEMHNRINSRSFGEEQIDNESSSDIYSEHRLRSTSSERQSTIKLEETQGKTYVIKKIDERNTVKIPQLNLDNIIESQKKKMYPFNLNQEGEIIEVEKPDSSLGTHNDEDAFIYDEQDQEESSSLLNEEVNENKKYSNLFENSFFSDLSSVKKSKNEEKIKEKEISEITKGKPKNGKDKLILIGDISNSSIRNSFLDQEINMDSMLIDHNDEEISMISKENSKSNVNILKEALSIEKLNNNQSNNYIFSPEKHRKDEQNSNEIRQNNFMRTDSNESIDRLDNFLKNSNGLQIFKNSRDKNVNILNDKDSKAKSVPADGRNINEDHITFGHHGYDMNDESESIMKNFECFNAQKDAIHQDKEDDFKNRNKSVVIPRSSILLKNKKNINKRNLELNCPDNIRQNNSVSPPKINETSSKFSKMVHDENDYKSNEKKFCGKLQFKDQNRAKFNFIPNNIVLKNEGNSINMNDNANKKTNKIKLMRNKIVPFKIIKKTKNSMETECRNSSLQLAHNPSSGVKQVINAQVVKVMKTDISQDFKMKGRKLNLRLKDFSQKKQILDHDVNGKASVSYQSENKSNKVSNAYEKQNSDYVNDSKKITNLSNYNTNSLVIHSNGREGVKVPSSLFSINQRRLNK